MMDPNELAFILVTYLLFVLKIGPVLMEGRPPMEIKRFLIVYNIFKIINSAVLSSKFFLYIVDKGLFPVICDHDEITLHVIATLYWKFFANKLLDLLDTVLFVLRKKDSQLTFLHVYHHAFMVMCSWTALKYDPSDHWAFMACLNCFIHAVMYTYYCLTALGPSFTKYLWWKKYLTMVQLTQFVLVMGHMVLQTSTSQCPIHAITYYMALSNTFLFILLFADFYVKRYKQPYDQVSTIGLACTRQDYD